MGLWTGLLLEIRCSGEKRRLRSLNPGFIFTGMNHTLTIRHGTYSGLADATGLKRQDEFSSKVVSNSIQNIVAAHRQCNQHRWIWRSLQ